MDYDELFKKYQSLLVEINDLRAENKKLKGQLGIIEQPAVIISDKISEAMLVSVINQKSEANGKIELYLSLFRGRNDVYAKRWKNREGKSGYTPVCLNNGKQAYAVNQK